MLDNRCYQDATPSVYFNFDSSNQKTAQLGIDKDDQSFVPYDYSYSTNKFQFSQGKNNNDSNNENRNICCKFITPPSQERVGSRIFAQCSTNQFMKPFDNNDQEKQQQVKKYQGACTKLDTEEFFEDFQNNFVINFGESPMKMEQVPQFRKTFDSCPGANSKDLVGSKIDSYISEPMIRRASSAELVDQQNEEDNCLKSPIAELDAQSHNIEKNKEKENIFEGNIDLRKGKKQSKINYEIKKRVVFKNQQKIANNISKKQDQPRSKIINHQNLMIITSGCRDGWTQLPQNRKTFAESSSRQIKHYDETLKKVESSIFNTRQMFKETLRSTTLDNWKKKFIIHRHELDQKHKAKTHNIFQKPFAIIR